jgi:hypothetical protein
MTLGNLANVAFYLLGAWASLIVLMLAASWAPVETALHAAKYLGLGVSGLALAVCVFGAGVALLGLSGMAVKPEAAPKPYQPQS